jgi:hypothetical protein
MGKPKQKINEEVTLNKYVAKDRSDSESGVLVVGSSVSSASFFPSSLPSLSVVLFAHNRKDQKKVTKLEAQIPYHEGRGNKDEIEKIKEQIASIWEKAREAAME